MALQDVVRNLARTPSLGELEADALRLIAFSAETRILRAGDVLFRQNDASDGGYVVLTGAIALETGLGSASIVEPPALIGDAALITQTARPCTAKALEPSSVLKISRDLFHRVLGEFPESAVRLRRSFGTRLAALGADLHQLQRNVT